MKPPGPDAQETLDATSHTGQSRRAPTQQLARLKSAYPADLNVTLDLDNGCTVLGRHPSEPGSPAIHHSKLSREHFAIEWDQRSGKHVGCDLGSRNGSWINGVPSDVGWHPLTPNSVVRLGGVLLLYEAGHTLEHPDAPRVSQEAIFGRAIPVRDLRAKLALAAPDPAPVLITGETGTGKEWIARELHERSKRTGRFVAINCATFSEQLIESQLFGHVKGAFTGATSDQEGLFRAADGGTLFLDEIGEMPLQLQPKLLRAIQEREVQPVGSTRTLQVNARVVAATHRDLEQRVRQQTFRQDLYARLAIWALSVPPLRERRCDILSWIDRLHQQWAIERGRAPKPLQLDSEAAEAILLSDWPENLRGLNRLVHELVLVDRPGPIRASDLPTWVKQCATC